MRLPEPIIPSATTPSYTIPLTLDSLERALQRGHGRAYLHAIVHDIPSELLIHALTHSLRYDEQCEEGAQDWYLAMASHHSQTSGILEKVISLALLAESTLDKYYIAGTLEHLHLMGHSQALPALYNLASYYVNKTDPPIPGGEELIRIEGEKGLVHVLHTLASSLPESHVDRGIIGYYFSQISGDSEKQYIEKLTALAASDTKLKPLLETVIGSHPRVQKRNAPATNTSKTNRSTLQGLSNQELKQTTASEVVECVRNSEPDDYGVWMRRWALLASRDALDEIISELLVEKDPHRIHKYLKAFNERSPLHRYDEQFASYLDHPLDKLRWTVHHAMATCPDPRVRELALERLSQEEIGWGSIRLFQSTYQPGDYQVIESALYIPDNMDTLHSIGFSLLDVFKQNTTPESVGSMLYVYEHGPCMSCRRQAIKIMQAASALPDWVEHEAHFDAESGIRELTTGSESLTSG